MTVVIFRVPSSLKIDFNYLETLSNNGKFDMHEIKNGNSEIIMYWRQLKPEQTVSFDLKLIKAIEGESYEKPHTAYLYYSKEDTVWVK